MTNNNEAEHRIQLSEAVKHMAKALENNTGEIKALVGTVAELNTHIEVSNSRLIAVEARQVEHRTAHCWWKQNVLRVLIYSGLTGIIGGVYKFFKP